MRFWGAGGGAVKCRQHKYSSSEGFTAQGCVLRLQNFTKNAKFLLQLVLLELVFLWRGLHSGADFGPENEKFKPSKTDELFFAPSGTEFNVHVLSLCSKQFKNGFLLILHYVFALKLINQALVLRMGFEVESVSVLSLT